MLTGNGRTATYTSFDMPVTISETGASDTFVYGPEHQRVKRQTATATTIYVNPDNSGGLAYEKDMTTGGTTLEERVFISAGGDPVAMLKRENGTGSITPYYLHRDNIGSTVAISSSTGAILERLAYEPFGRRRASDGASDPTNAIKGVNSDRGFTDHEHLDDLTLVHTNGRVFDPLVGRFLSGDPHIQFTDDLQSYNRYSYVSNNPLNSRDPTGYFSLFDGMFTMDGFLAGGPAGGFAGFEAHKFTVQYLAAHQWAYSLAQTVVAAATAYYCGGCGTALLASDVTYARTGSYKASLKAGSIAYAEYYVIGPPGGGGNVTASILINAAVGCASAAASGGKCGAGALSAGFAAGAGQLAGSNPLLQVVVGGTASVLGGGTFSNGAISAAFIYAAGSLANSGSAQSESGGARNLQVNVTLCGADDHVCDPDEKGHDVLVSGPTPESGPIEYPGDLSQFAAGLRRYPSPEAAFGATVLVGAGGGSILAGGAASLPALRIAVRGPAFAALLELTGGQVLEHAAEDVAVVEEDAGYAYFLRTLKQLADAVKSLEVPEESGPMLPWGK